MDLTLFSALIDQLLHNPAGVLLILPVSIVAYILEVWPKFPSKWILPVCPFIGMLLYPFLISTKSVPEVFPHPLFALVLYGFILGFIAWVIHSTLVKWIIFKFQPPSSPAVSDTSKTSTPYKSNE